jgi:hypothetical protein
MWSEDKTAEGFDEMMTDAVAANLHTMTQQ